MLPVKTKHGNSGKWDKDNKDLEEDEIHILWEIDRNWNAKYFRRNNIERFKVKSHYINLICNHRKQRNQEGELLVKWNNGEREWSAISNIKTDLEDTKLKNKKNIDIDLYLKQFKLTIKNMGHNLKEWGDKKQLEMEEKSKQILEQKKMQ